MFNKNQKSVSALIATILLVVIAVALIAVILTWGKSFTNTNLTKTNNLLNAPTSDAQYYLTIEDGLNGRYLVKYNPPLSFYKKSITITRYRLFDYNNIINFNTPIDINAGQTQALDLGITHSSFDLVLYLDDNTIITKQNLKNTNLSPRAIDCPTGFIPVPGNYLYGTVEGNGGFCVAKYEMKIDENGDGVGDSNSFCQYTTVGVWDNNVSTCGYNFGTRALVSSASGYPLAKIDQTTSATACASIGGHLITNNEWMTIVRNIEMVTSNWSSGIVGTGYIYSGHNDNAPSRAISEGELVTNGGFDVNTGWGLVNSTIAGGICTINAIGSSTYYIVQPNFFIGKYYKVTLQIRRISGSGNVTVWLGTGNQQLIDVNSDWNTVTIYGTMSGNTAFYVIANNTTQVLEVDNISITEIDASGYYGTGNTSGNQRRTLTLTNGEVIWDLAGNVYEWTNNIIQRKDMPDGYLNSTDEPYTGGWNWEDYNKASGGTYYLKSNNLGNTTFTYNDLFLLSSNNYNASINGIGRMRIYSDSSDTDTTVYGFMRSGTWNNTAAYAGLLALSLFYDPSLASASVGFRCIIVP